MTNAITITHKTALARWLFEHDITLREGARLFETNRTSLSAFANGAGSPTGQTRDLITKTLLGELTLLQLRARLRDARPQGEAEARP